MKLENKSQIYKNLISNFGKPKTTKGIFHIFQSGKKEFVIFDTQQLQILCDLDLKKKPKLTDYVNILDVNDINFDDENYDFDDYIEDYDTGILIPRHQYGLYRRIVSGIVENLWNCVLDVMKISPKN